MSKAEVTAPQSLRWINRALVILGVVVFIPLIYLGTAPYAAMAVVPASAAADQDGFFAKSVESYFWPIRKVGELWPWYNEWAIKVITE